MGMKSNIKQNEILCLSWNPRWCTLQASSNRQQVEKFKVPRGGFHERRKQGDWYTDW